MNRLAQKSAREAIAKLMDVELLVKCEEISNAEIRSVASSLSGSNKHIAKYYYIDYQSFVNVVRLRIHWILKSVESQEASHIEEIYFECPTCKIKYTSLEASKMLSSDYKFICSSCCPDFDLSRAVSQPSFRLKEIDCRGEVSEVQKLERKLKEQFTRTVDHEGIREMLNELKDVTLSRNKPSDNMRRGIRTSDVSSSEIVSEIKDIIVTKTTAKQAVDIKDRHFNLLSTRIDGTEKVIETSRIPKPMMTSNDASSSDSTVKPSLPPVKRIRESDLPDFLNTSGVKGSDQILLQVESLHNERGVSVTTSTIPSSSFNNVNEYASISQPTVIINTQYNRDDILHEYEAAGMVVDGEGEYVDEYEDDDGNEDDIEWEGGEDDEN